MNVLTGVKDGSHWRVPDHRKFHDQRCVPNILDSAKLLMQFVMFDLPFSRKEELSATFLLDHGIWIPL